MLFELFRFFVRIVLNIFFRDIKVRGLHNIPDDGPVLLAAAIHANQFVDPLMLTITCGRAIGFLAAKKSMNKWWFSPLAKIMNSIPVERPQDLAKNGVGTISKDDDNPLVIRGRNTRFKSLSKKTTLALLNGIGSATVKEIVSDTELLLVKPFEGEAAIAALESVDESGTVIGAKYKTIPFVDQSSMFDSVVKRLARNAVVGIFPEGGSHDRSEMLPLKAGVAIMALETLSKFPGTKLKVVPAGIHYFNADKFRSRSVVEYGEPIEVPIELVDEYQKGGVHKRRAISLLLDTIHVRLKALTLQATDFESLIVAQATRRLYQTEKLDADSALTISRRFAEAYEKLKGVPKVKELTDEVLKYNRMLKFYGVRDHQVKNTRLGIKRAIFLTMIRYIEVLFLLIITAPVLLLFLPLFVVTNKVSKDKAKEAKAGSTVKIVGKDVIATWKLITAMIVAPILWLVYTVITFISLYVMYDYRYAAQGALLFFIGLPFAATSSIRLSDLLFDVSQSIRPLVVSIGNVMSSSQPLSELRSDLQVKIWNMVEEMGPEMFEDFDQTRVVKPEDFILEDKSYSDIVKKLNRRTKINSAGLARVDLNSNITALFHEEIDRVKIDF